MPLYEYRCKNCGDRFEALQRFSDEPLKTHEKCGGAVERLLSAPSFQFKGTGWYVTDYGRGNGAGNGKGHKESKESKTETPAKTESKPAPSEAAAKS
jgi:putative FmdB family regulatory protein